MDFIGFINSEWGAAAAVKLEMLEDFCDQYGYQEFLPDEEGNLTIPNPESRKAFANGKIKQYIIETVNAIRIQRAKEAAPYTELDLS